MGFQGFRVGTEVDSFRGLGFRVESSGFRVQGSGLRVRGSGLRVQDVGFQVSGAIGAV